MSNTHLSHATKIKTSYNIFLRKIEQNKRLPDHLYFYRLAMDIPVLVNFSKHNHL